MKEYTVQAKSAAGSGSGANRVLRFGPFHLDLATHALREGDQPLRMGHRAFEILITLLERAGEVVSTSELMARVWPKAGVQQVTLRVHIAELRKTLRDNERGVRYIQNIPRRGYRFVGPVEQTPAPSSRVISLTPGPVPSAIPACADRFGNLQDPPIATVDRKRIVSPSVGSCDPLSCNGDGPHPCVDERCPGPARIETFHTGLAADSDDSKPLQLLRPLPRFSRHNCPPHPPIGRSTPELDPQTQTSGTSTDMKPPHDKSVQDNQHPVLTFGPFRLDPVRYVLHKGDQPIRLGSRALEILILLAQRSGQVVSKNELLDRVWPKGVGQEATLRVHVAALRKVLGDTEEGTRYVDNFSGRGYRFVAPVTRAMESPTPQPATLAATRDPDTQHTDTLPVPLARMFGRTQAIATLTERSLQQRLITVVGPGGVGKSVVAAASAQQQAAAYEHGIRFVDLSVASDERSVHAACAAALEIPDSPQDLMSDIHSFLEDKSMLIVLDNCERVVAAAAAVAEEVLRRSPRVHLLATSRESLRAACEFVFRLPPLEVPPPTASVTRADALACPATRLFIERASAALDSFELTEDELPAVVEICRRLEGNPLAIELAAARVDFFGVRGLAARLDDCLGLLTRGPRTAAPRHRSLRATLDWSYEQLSPLEQLVLRRIAVFPGHFTVESANKEATDEQAGAAEVFEALTDLVAKSLLGAHLTEQGLFYRLAEINRAYAMEKLRSSAESYRATRPLAWPEATSVMGW